MVNNVNQAWCKAVKVCWLLLVLLQCVYLVAAARNRARTAASSRAGGEQ